MRPTPTSRDGLAIVCRFIGRRRALARALPASASTPRCHSDFDEARTMSRDVAGWQWIARNAAVDGPSEIVVVKPCREKRRCVSSADARTVTPFGCQTRRFSSRRTVKASRRDFSSRRRDWRDAQTAAQGISAPPSRRSVLSDGREPFLSSNASATTLFSLPSRRCRDGVHAAAAAGARPPLSRRPIPQSGQPIDRGVRWRRSSGRRSSNRQCETTAGAATGGLDASAGMDTGRVNVGGHAITNRWWAG